MAFEQPYTQQPQQSTQQLQATAEHTAHSRAHLVTEAVLFSTTTVPFRRLSVLAPSTTVNFPEYQCRVDIIPLCEHYEYHFQVSHSSAAVVVSNGNSAPLTAAEEFEI